MDIRDILLLIVSVVTVLLGFFVVRSEEKRPSNTAFTAFSLAVCFWSLGLFFFRISEMAITSILAAKFFYIAATAIAVFFLEFSLLFSQERPLGTKRRLFLYIPLILFSFLLIFTKNFLIEGIIKKSWGKQIILNAGDYLLYNIFFIFYIGYAYKSLFKIYRATREQIIRLQFKYIFLGTIGGFIIGMITNLFLPWVTYRYIWIGPLTGLMMTVAISYAISKHRLLNVKVIATEFFSSLLVLVFLVRFIISESLGEFILNGSIVFVATVVGIFLIRSVWKEVRIREEMESLSRQLATANEELKKLDAAKSEFVSIAGHQLRAPLTVIRGYTSLLLEGSFGEIGKKAREALDKVTFSTNQLVKLVSDLLDLSRIESGKIRYEFSENNLAEVVERVLKEFTESIKQKGLKLEWQNESQGLSSFAFDKDKMREVVVNLLHNAIKYSPQGSEIIVRLENISGIPKQIRLSVQDQGIGIAEADKKKLFAKFGRTEEAQKLDPGGMGIGLYFVKRVVEDHHGRVGIESPGPGKGSTFWVELPTQK